jgi:hypothetical protein
MSGSPRGARVAAFALVVAAVAALGACGENITGSNACPTLCPEGRVVVRDTVIDPFSTGVGLDTTLVGFPPLGTESALLLASRGDTLRAGFVVRYDTLPRYFLTSSDTTDRHQIVGIDTAFVSFTVTAATTNDSLVLEVVDVDLPVPDIDTASVRAQLDAAPVLGEKAFRKDSIVGVQSIQLPDSFVQSRITTGKRIRLGFRVRPVHPDSSVQVLIGTSESGSPVQLGIRARSDRPVGARNPDTSTIAINPGSSSGNQTGPGIPNLVDYTLVLHSTLAPPPGLLMVGGLPAARTYLRFEIPAGIVESTTVVSATLLLTQKRFAPIDSTDSITVTPLAGLAGGTLDPGHAALLVAPPSTSAGVYGLPAKVFQPVTKDTLREFKLVFLARQWRFLDTLDVQRAVALATSDEGVFPPAVSFYSSREPVESLRPRMHLTYVPRTGAGAP